MEPLHLVDHLKSFQLSVANAPIDSAIDIIRFFLKNMEDDYLPQLGDPRSLYAPLQHRKLKNVPPQQSELTEELQFFDLANKLGTTQTSTMLLICEPQASQTLKTRQIKAPQNITPMLQERITQLEKHLQLKLNPWKICCFELVIRQLTEILLNFDPKACYYDKRIQHTYKLFSHPKNQLTAEEVGLQPFFEPEAAEALPSWQLARQILKNMHSLKSPS